jgi:hypothetical protein
MYFLGLIPEDTGITCPLASWGDLQFIIINFFSHSIQVFIVEKPKTQTNSCLA